LAVAVGTAATDLHAGAMGVTVRRKARTIARRRDPMVRLDQMARRRELPTRISPASTSLRPTICRRTMSSPWKTRFRIVT
jgi:hypothetical protein